MLSLGLGFGLAGWPVRARGEGTTVAFVGHSLVSPTLPPTYASAAGVPAYYQVINGSPLFWNWDHHDEAEGVSVRNLLGTGAVDHLVLCEGGPIEGNISGNDTRGWLQTWRDAGIAANPDMETFWYQIWPDIQNYETAPDWAFWRSEIARLADEAYGVVAQQIASDIGDGRIYIVPAGEALSALWEAVDNDLVPDVTDFKTSFFPGDSIHITHLGLYFIAMVHYATLTRQTPVGLPWNLAAPVAGLTADLAEAMQALAWEVVSNHPYAGIADWPEPAEGDAVILSEPQVFTADDGAIGDWGGDLDVGTARPDRHVAVIVASRVESTVTAVSIGGIALVEQENAGESSYHGIWLAELPDDASGLQSLAITTATGSRGLSWAAASIVDGAIAEFKTQIVKAGDRLKLQANGGDGLFFVMLTDSIVHAAPPVDELAVTYYEHPNNNFQQFQLGHAVLNTIVNAEIYSEGYSTKLGITFSNRKSAT